MDWIGRTVRTLTTGEQGVVVSITELDGEKRALLIRTKMGLLLVEEENVVEEPVI